MSDIKKCIIVFSGLSRLWQEAFPSFKRNFLDKYDTDIYACLWTECGFYSGRSYVHAPGDEYVKTTEDDKGFNTSGKLMDVNGFMEAYEPKVLKLLDFSKYEHIFDEKTKGLNGYTRPKNTLAQAFMVQEAMKLVPRYDVGPDTLIVRARPDFVIDQDVGGFNLDTFYTFKFRNKHNQGTGDMIQIGNYVNMERFAKMYDQASYLYEINNVSCPHIYTKGMIDWEHIPWEELHVQGHCAHSPNGPYTESE